MVAVGQAAPDFALPNQNGQTIRLQDFRGKKVIIFAFPKAGTAGCTMQACGFRDMFPQISAENTIVLGLSTDQPQQLKKWHTDQNLQYDLLSDPQQKVIDAWNAGGMSLLGIVRVPRAKRSYWVIDESGTIIDMQIGVGPRASVDQALRAVQQA
jgi:thioredoxin-dependent peroxiredoxin